VASSYSHLSAMQTNQASYVKLGQPFKAVPFVTSDPLFENALQVPPDSPLVNAPFIGLPVFPNKMSHRLAGLKIPNCQEVPETRLGAWDAYFSRAPSTFFPGCKNDKKIADEFTHLRNEAPKRTKKSKAHGFNARIRPAKSERMLCKSLAHTVFVFQQAHSLKDMAEAEIMLVRALHGARADPRSNEYAISVLHALFAEMG